MLEQCQGDGETVAVMVTAMLTVRNGTRVMAMTRSVTAATSRTLNDAERVVLQ
jgi:hypothetical protein